MTRRERQRAQALERITEHILHNGLARTSLRQLAAAAAVSDRMLLYYFADKTDVLTAALERIALNMAVLLDEALPENATFTAEALLAQATVLTRNDRLRPYMRLGLEISAAAARGEAPYRAVSGQIVRGFMGWIESRLAIEDDTERKRSAAMILVLIDGLALFDACGADDVADQAIAAILGLAKGSDA